MTLIPASVPHGDQIEDASSSDQRSLSILSTRIRTLDELLAKAEVNRDEWDVDRYTVNQWEVGAKGPDNRIVVEPLFQVKAWLKRRSPQEVGILRAMREIWNRKPSYPSVKLPKPIGPYMLDISIPDLHFGKLCWAPETGSDYDIKIASELFRKTLQGLLGKASQYKFSKILYVVGNDFFNTDDGRETTAGTVQDEDGRWQKTFTLGTELTIWSIDLMRQYAPLHVMVIPGNHDTKRSYYMGECLVHRYNGAANVTIDNSPESRKYLRWGRNLLGITHGDKEKKEQLADIMAAERPKDFAECRWRHWKTGHLHHHRREVILSRVTHRDTIVESLPSISGTDAYHKQHGYHGDRSAKAILWHPDRGPEVDLWHWVEE